MTPLNVNGQDFCKKAGLPYSRQLLSVLREHGLVSFYKIGVKFWYSLKDSEKLSDLLTNKAISIKTEKGIYYVTKE